MTTIRKIDIKTDPDLKEFYAPDVPEKMGGYYLLINTDEPGVYLKKWVKDKKHPLFKDKKANIYEEIEKAHIKYLEL